MSPPLFPLKDSGLACHRKIAGEIPRLSYRSHWAPIRFSAVKWGLMRLSMSAAEREALLKKLDAFESELEKRRLNMMAVTRLTYLVLNVPGTVWASVDITLKLTTNIMQTVAEAKAAEEETKQLPAAAPPKALSAPCKPPTPRPPFDDNLDDDVPF